VTRGARWAGLAVGVLVLATAFPFYWTVVASLTPESRLFGAPSLLPTQLVLDHYRALFVERAFWVPIRNSLVVAGCTTVFSVIVGSLCAYALARLRFRGKTPLLGLVLAVSMFPQISVVSPLFLLLRSLRLIDTYPGLILPYLTFALRSRCGSWSASSASSRPSWKRPRWWTAPAGSAPSGR
jgi:ABC-type glycerol-3-phosphate transport system permease component